MPGFNLIWIYESFFNVALNGDPLFNRSGEHMHFNMFPEKVPSTEFFWVYHPHSHFIPMPL